MIRYSLRCDQGHEFDGWFRSSDGFEMMRAAGQVGCAICGSVRVEKALMAPRVAHGDGDSPADLHSPRDPREAALDQLRQHVEANSDYVGMSFAAEARAMHEGDTPERGGRSEDHSCTRDKAEPRHGGTEDPHSAEELRPRGH